MSSRIFKSPRQTAAWRLSIWTTLAFALGTALSFAVMYYMVAASLQRRTDAWLSGEAEVLADVATNTPQDNLYDRLVKEVAELATREVSDDESGHEHDGNSVFFLETAENQSPLWVGPGSQERFLNAIQDIRFEPGVPQSIRVADSPMPFRVVASSPRSGRAIYLGLSDHAATHVLHELTLRFLMVWAAMVLFGFVIAYAGARRTLIRVERITEMAAHIGTDDLASRLPEPKHTDEISRLSRTFNRMLERIQASVNQLRTLTDSVAHDLKSPVTSIRGRLEVALFNNDDKAWREPVAEAIEALDRMSQLLNTSLDLAEAEGGALHLERRRFDLTSVVRQLVDLYQPAFLEHQHDLIAEFTEQVFVDGDVALIRRVLGNLLDNELTHLPSGRHVAINLTLEETAQLEVEDNGPGFPKDIRGHALDRFVKGKDSPGHGLGLAFVDAVIRAHGGTTEISDRPGGGARITLSFPLA
jgi:signal transduction histidine kinase